RARHDGRLTDQGLFQITGLCQDVHAFLFQQLAIDAIDEYRVYDSGLESLALNSLIAYRLEQNLIALRIDAKIFQPEHDADPGPAAAHTVDGEFFPAQIFGSLDIWANHYVIRVSAGKSCQHLDVMACRYCG